MAKVAVFSEMSSCIWPPAMRHQGCGGEESGAMTGKEEKGEGKVEERAKFL